MDSLKWINKGYIKARDLMCCNINAEVFSVTLVYFMKKLEGKLGYWGMVFIVLWKADVQRIGGGGIKWSLAWYKVGYQISVVPVWPCQFHCTRILWWVSNLQSIEWQFVLWRCSRPEARAAAKLLQCVLTGHTGKNRDFASWPELTPRVSCQLYNQSICKINHVRGGLLADLIFQGRVHASVSSHHCEQIPPEVARTSHSR